MPLQLRILFVKVPFEIASIDRGRDNVDIWSICPFVHDRVLEPPSNFGIRE